MEFYCQTKFNNNITPKHILYTYKKYTRYVQIKIKMLTATKTLHLDRDDN